MEGYKNITCLKRLGDNIKKYKLIHLSGKDEVKIGRSPDVSVCILSTMISRCHAILKKTKDNKWTITDNKSLNGVYINNVKLESNKAKELQEGDIVQFGVSKVADEPAEFMYTFYENLPIKRTLKDASQDAVDGPKYPMKRIRLDDDREAEAKKRILQKSVTNNENSDKVTDKKVCDSGVIDKKVCDSQVTSSQPDLGCSDGDNDSVRHKRHNDKHKQPDWSPYQDYKEKMLLKDKESEEKAREYEKRLQDMQELLKAKDVQQIEMKNALAEEKKRHDEQAREMDIMLEQKQKEMDEQLRLKQEEEDRLREELENHLMSREAQMMEQLQAQREAVLAEKVKVEDQLKQAMDKALEEKDRKLEAELTKQKEKLEGDLAKKELEQKMLESQLNDTKAEKDKHKEAMLHAREDILSNFSDLMEMELQCSICSELFIRATSLNCSHSFCEYCISEWCKIKNECPICRAAITSRLRSIVLDSYIDKMIEHLSEELKQRRKQMVDSRQDEMKKKEEAAKPNTAGRGRGGRQRGGRGRGRGRGRGGQARVNNAPAPGPSTSTAPVAVDVPEVATTIVIESDVSDHMDISSGEEEEEEEEESELDSDEQFYSEGHMSDSDDSDYIRGEGGAYFGGYGRCYRCGMRGHWANGCPLT